MSVGKYLTLCCMLLSGLNNPCYAVEPSDESINPQVIEIQSLSEITLSLKAKVIYLFDLDDTVFVHPCSLGSKKWREDIEEQVIRLIDEDPEIKNKIPADQNAKQVAQKCHDFISYSLASTFPVVSVEPKTGQYIQELQENGNTVWALTRRERNVWHDTPTEGVDTLTNRQLHSIGIDFQHPSSEQNYPNLPTLDHYAYGIHFCPHDLKGEYFQEQILSLLQSDGLPNEIIFVDDNLAQVQSMAEALSRNGICHKCYHYQAIHKKDASYDPLIPSIQLSHFWNSKKEPILSDEQAHDLAQKHPEQNAQSYLKPVLLDVLYSLYPPQYPKAPLTHYVFDAPPENFRPVINVGGCFMIWEDKVLFLKRVPSTTWGGTWGVPGGALKKNEETQAGTLRETSEETGIDLTKEQITYLGTVYIRDPQKDFIYSMYECRFQKPPQEVVICPKEHTAYRWMTFKEALCETLIPGEDECIYRCYPVDE